jgi:hypothetical protein
MSSLIKVPGDRDPPPEVRLLRPRLRDPGAGAALSSKAAFRWRRFWPRSPSPNDGSGRTWATVATFLQTAKMNDVDPFTWLTHTLERLANRWPIS